MALGLAAFFFFSHSACAAIMMSFSLCDRVTQTRQERTELRKQNHVPNLPILTGRQLMHQKFAFFDINRPEGEQSFTRICSILICRTKRIWEEMLLILGRSSGRGSVANLKNALSLFQ